MRSVSFGLALASALAPALAGGTVAAEEFPCGAAVAALLYQHGQFADTMQDVRTQAYTWADELTPQVSGWRWSGESPQCADGRIVVSLWPNCQVTDIYTTGDCRIPGIRRNWY